MINKIVLSLMMLVALSACSGLKLGDPVAKKRHYPTDTTGDFKVGNPYEIKGRTYTPSERYQGSEVGVASWYGPGFNGKQTANGEIFNKNDLTAAHRTLQMPSMVRVTNLENGRSVIVRVNDRGPFSDDRIIDVSEKAAEALQMKSRGTARVRVDVLEKESRMVASAAREGKSTRGTELALNRGQKLRGMELKIATPVSKPANVRYARNSQPIYIASPIRPSENTAFSQILSDQVNSSNQNASRVSNELKQYYVQTGSFQNEDNALTMKMALYNVQEPINIIRSVENGSQIYKVKIGPMRSVEKADEILTLLNKQGRQATMVVAQN